MRMASRCKGRKQKDNGATREPQLSEVIDCEW